MARLRLDHKAFDGDLIRSVTTEQSRSIKRNGNRNSAQRAICLTLLESACGIIQPMIYGLSSRQPTLARLSRITDCGTSLTKCFGKKVEPTTTKGSEPSSNSVGAPSNRNLITEYYGGGLVYKGLLPNRDEDYLGVGVANAILTPGSKQIALANGEFQGRQETAVELFYKYRVSPYFVLQPDLQFISQPSGRFDDALLPGLRFEVVAPL